MTRGEVWWADLEQPIGTRPVLIITTLSSRKLVDVEQALKFALELQ